MFVYQVVHCSLMFLISSSLQNIVHFLFFFMDLKRHFLFFMRNIFMYECMYVYETLINFVGDYGDLLRFMMCSNQFDETGFFYRLLMTDIPLSFLH